MDQTCEILVRPVLVMEATSAIPTPLEHWSSAVLLLPCLAIFIFASQDDAVPTKSFAQPLGCLALAIPFLFLNFRDVVTFSDGKGDSWWKLAKISRRLRQKLPEAAALGADVLYLGHIPGAPWRRCGMDEWTLRNVVATLSRKGVQCDNDWQCVSLVLGLLCKFGKSCQMFREKKKPGLYEAEYLWTSTTWYNRIFEFVRTNMKVCMSTLL